MAKQVVDVLDPCNRWQNLQNLKKICLVYTQGDHRITS